MADRQADTRKRKRPRQSSQLITSVFKQPLFGTVLFQKTEKKRDAQNPSTFNSFLRKEMQILEKALMFMAE
ncbi:hypothetical protein [Chimaeribacter arupi]|uniref:hypothetical protein n=1 Tax=Chimaeribacter arupi TaxID=2060066 RepID=UPI000C7A1729|nr:hypothetical protein [Chimaeribacter arupi]PLR49743.1 hypothetical protein CYR52_11775 [Chimaeribacter arupi]